MKRPAKRSPALDDAAFAAANAKFDRLLDAMTKASALPRKKRRAVERQAEQEEFDD